LKKRQIEKVKRQIEKGDSQPADVAGFGQKGRMQQRSGIAKEPAPCL